jgi:phage shock protein PspC (stress-responsive transcriptional regulator)
MNKTISVNISGIIFNIEELAYDRLKGYLEAIRSHFANSRDCDEIMADIEGRIAELFQERISEVKEVISMSDVEEVVAIMGRPEDYADQDMDDDYNTSSEDTTSGTIPNTGTRKNRRIFRDPDNTRIGGVCSGLSAYFGWDPIWLRIAFLVTFFWFGTGMLLYIVLWIIIPEAKTTADKLEMQGDPVNVENIGKAFGKTGSETIDDLADHARIVDTDANAQKVKNASWIIMGYFGAFFKMFGKFFGAALILASIGMMIVLGMVLLSSEGFVTITDSGVAALSYANVSALLFGSTLVSNLAWTGILLVVGVPILSFMYTGIKLLFNLQHSSKSIGITMTSIWVVGLVMCGYVAISTGTDFVSESSIEEDFVFEQPVGDTLYLDILNDPYFSNNYRHHHNFTPDLIHVDEKEIHFGWPMLDVKENKRNDNFEIVLSRESQGPNQKTAISLAENITYTIEQNGDQLNFAPFFSVLKSDKFRGQQLDITVLVPKGKAIYFSDDMDRIIYDVENVTNTRDRRMVDHYWVMTRQVRVKAPAKFVQR